MPGKKLQDLDLKSLDYNLRRPRLLGQGNLIQEDYSRRKFAEGGELL